MNSALFLASSFFAMGGYGLYIWPSYGLALLLFIGLTFWAYRHLRCAKALLEYIQSVQIHPTKEQSHDT